MAGEPWTEYPSNVHPTLCAVGRAVDDHTSASGRAGLLPLAPAMVGTAHAGFETSARLVALCVSTALASTDRQRLTAEEDNRLARARDLASYTLRRCAGVEPSPADEADHPTGRLRGSAAWWFPILDLVGLSERFYRHFVAPRHATAAVEVTAHGAAVTDRDRRLRQLLRLCVGVCPATEKGNSDLEI
ncbi:MAG: hypothetical protein ACRDOY_10665 [Nocardioidaceae bacterium]